MSSTQFLTDSEGDDQTPGGLSNILTEISELDGRMDSVEAELKRMKARRTRLADLAVEEMTSGGLDGVKVAGRSWRVEVDHHLSVPMDRRDAVLEAARDMGLDIDALTQVSTARLKTMLKETATEAGRDARRPFSEGTPLDGLVGEYVGYKLRHRTN